VTHEKRYNTAAIILHWAMALGFLLMFFSGVIMEYVDVAKSLKFSLYQWHKSGGVLLLIAFVLRLILRLFKRPPALPAHIKRHEAVLAKLGHWGLYVMMFAMPFTGWLMVSSSVYGLPTIVFNLFEWPHIPGVQGDKQIHDVAKQGHFILAITFFALIMAHIGAVLKHALFDRENLLRRMWWGKNIADKTENQTEIKEK
jgi:cytochrome b561